MSTHPIPAIGATAYICNERYGTSRKCVIEKVTPTGRVVAASTQQVGEQTVVNRTTFVPCRWRDGVWEKYGTHSFYDYVVLRFDTDAVEKEARRKAQKQDAERKLNAFLNVKQVRAEWGKGDMIARLAELRAMLAEAESAVNAIEE